MANNQFYLAFENQFRGERKNVINTFYQYLGLIRTIQNTNLNPNHLDIGCGRGEWLEICKNEGFNSLGIDSNKYMVNEAQDNGLNVIEGDAIEILKTLPDNSFHLISGFHIIEHLTYETIISLLYECKRLLSETGVLLLETPSIDNLSVSSRLFYLDPTHINPINPDSLVFHIQQLGFHKAKYFLINGGPLQLSSEHTLTRVLNGISQDVCFIATKSEKCTNHLFERSCNWQLEINKSISTLDAAHDHDNYIRQLESKITSLEDAIYMIRTKLISYEKSNISFMNWRESLSKNYLVKFANLVNRILIFSRKIFIKLISISFILLRKIDLNIFILFILNRRKFAKLIIKVMGKIGFRVQADKLIMRINQSKVYKHESRESNQYLLRHFHSSELAKKIFTRLESKEAPK
tara:strand:+ start:655 stop:1875 length:1221 start_codon:yes stop_codon:yes gene_type:complete